MNPYLIALILSSLIGSLVVICTWGPDFVNWLILRGKKKK